ncbi:hypothetical protein, partial [Helicobacter pylori]|uniref:hypothetical protein n=1 Tax=Helicobacter pylori TaxID=210 RepID=UPI001C62FD2D
NILPPNKPYPFCFYLLIIANFYQYYFGKPPPYQKQITNTLDAELFLKNAPLNLKSWGFRI